MHLLHLGIKQQTNELKSASRCVWSLKLPTGPLFRCMTNMKVCFTSEEQLHTSSKSVFIDLPAFVYRWDKPVLHSLHVTNVLSHTGGISLPGYKEQVI